MIECPLCEEPLWDEDMMFQGECPCTVIVSFGKAHRWDPTPCAALNYALMHGMWDILFPDQVIRVKGPHNEFVLVIPNWDDLYEHSHLWMEVHGWNTEGWSCTHT